MQLVGAFKHNKIVFKTNSTIELRTSGRHACGMLNVGRTVGKGEKFSIAQWSSGRHKCGMLGVGRTVG